MKCKTCGKAHGKNNCQYTSTTRLRDDSVFPTHEKGYLSAHERSNKAEESKFGKKQFNKLEKYVRGASKHELIGKNTRSGKIEVEDKIPSQYRPEVAFHEEYENNILRKGMKHG